MRKRKPDQPLIFTAFGLSSKRSRPGETVPEPSESHSDSLDTLWYARFSIQNHVFYEWKQKNLGWAPSHDPTTTILAPWLSATPCSVYERKKTSKSLSHPELEPFQKFTIPLENLQFPWKYVSL